MILSRPVPVGICTFGERTFARLLEDPSLHCQREWVQQITGEDEVHRTDVTGISWIHEWNLIRCDGFIYLFSSCTGLYFSRASRYGCFKGAKIFTVSQTKWKTRPSSCTEISVFKGFDVFFVHFIRCLLMQPRRHPSTSQRCCSKCLDLL